MAVIGTATIEIHAALDAVRDEVKRGIDEAMAGLGNNVNIKINVDSIEANVKLDEIRAKLAEISALNPTINVNADTGGADAKLLATKAIADGMHDKGPDVSPKADSSQALKAFEKIGLAVTGLGISTTILGNGTIDKFALIGGAGSAAAGAIGGAFAALPAVFLGLGAAGGVAAISLQGVSTALKGMSPDATAAQIKAMNQALADMGPAAQTTVKEIGAIRPAFDNMKMDVQNTALQGLGTSFQSLANTALPMMDQGLSKVAGSMNIGVHSAIQGLIGDAPQFQTMWNNIGQATDLISKQSVPSVTQSFVTMGSVGSSVLPQLAAQVNGLTSQFSTMLNQSIAAGTFQQALAGFGPIIGSLGTIINTLLGVFIQLGAQLEGPLANALYAINALLKPLEPVLGALGGAVMQVVTALANALLPVIQTLGPFLTQFFNLLGPSITQVIMALAPVVTQLAQALGQILVAIVPLIGPFASTLTLFKAVGDIISALVPIIQPLVNAVVSIATAVNAALVPVLPLLTQAIQALVNAFVPLIPLFAQVIVQIINQLAPFLPIIIKAFIDLVKAFAPLLPVLLGLLPPLLSLVGVILPPLTALLKFMADNGWLVVAAFSAWAAVKLTETVGGWAGSLGDVLTKLSYLPNGAGDGEKAIGGLSKAFDAFKDLPGTIGPAITGIKDFVASSKIAELATKAWTAVQVAFDAVMDANPIALLVIAIAALIAAVVLIITHFSEFKKIVSEVWDWISGVFVTGLHWLENTWTTVWNDIVNFFKGIWNDISSWFMGVLNDITSFFKNIWNDVSNFFSTVWNAIADYFIKLWTVRFQQPVMAIWNAIAGFFTTAFNDFKSFFETIWNFIAGVFQTVWNFISKIATDVWNVIKSFFITEFDAFKAIFTTIWNAISAVFQAVWNFISSVATTVWNAISSFFVGAFDAFKSVFSSVWNAISSVFSTVWNAISGVAQSVWNGIKGFFVTAFNDFTGFFKGVWNGISSFFSGIWDGIANVAKKAWDLLKQGAAEAINWLISPIDSIIHGINKVTGFFFIKPIPDIPPVTFAMGGKLGLVPELAAGGSLFESIGSGFKTNGPKAIVGEGNPNYPEYVIPTDPSYRTRALNLLGSAAEDMGLMAAGGSLKTQHPLSADGTPMLGLGDMLSNLWNNTGGKVVHAVASGWDDVTSWILTKAAEGVAALLNPIKDIMPHNFLGEMVSGSIDKLETSIVAWIKGQQKQQAAAGGGNSGVPAGHASNVAAVQSVASSYGWSSGPEWDALVKVINRESGFNNVAQNPTSTAYGMFQFLDSTWAGYGTGKTSDPLAQARAGLAYIHGRYGDPLGAWAHEVSAGWYDNGGWLRPGLTLAQNDTGQNELIMPVEKLKQILREAQNEDYDSRNDRAIHAIADFVRDTMLHPVSQFAASAFQSKDPLAVPGGPSVVQTIAQTVAETVAKTPQTSTAATISTGTGSVATAFKDALSQFAPELNQAVSAGAATQVVQFGQALLANPARMAALNQSVADALGVPVSSMAGRVQDMISSALPTMAAESHPIDPTTGAARALSTAHSTVSSTSTANPVTIHPGAFQVVVNGNADSVTVDQLHSALRDWNDELLHQVRGRR